ncbi:uncharacterized protein LOC144872223 [Branchiostoma floridae x Branchiostoma japonicum]
MNNRITMIQSGTIANLPRLRLLDLSDNRISNIQACAFENLPRLEKLFLAQNKIKLIAIGQFASIPRTRELDLAYNRIKVIHPGTFANLPLLQRLYISNNQITMIQPGAFAYPTKLLILDLRSNKMSALPPLDGLFTSIPVVKLDGNPWLCDCRMVPFRLKFPSFKDQIICAQPAKFRGQKLTDVNPKELICEEPNMSSLPLSIHVSSNNCCNVPTARSKVGPAGKTRVVLTSPLGTTPDKPKSSSSHVNTQVTPNNRHNGTTIRSTVRHVENTSAALIANTSDKPESNFSTHFDTQVTSKNCYDVTAMRSTVGCMGKTSASLPSTTLDKPKSKFISTESAPSVSLPVLIASVCGSVAGTLVVVAIVGAIWRKWRTENPLAYASSDPTSNIALSNTNATATVMTRGHNQTAQGQFGTKHLPHIRGVSQTHYYVDADTPPNPSKHESTDTGKPIKAVSFAPPRKFHPENGPHCPSPTPHDDNVGPGALYMKPEDVLYEMPANSRWAPPRKSPPENGPHCPSPLRHDDNVRPDGSLYMKPEDVLYEMPANSR